MCYVLKESFCHYKQEVTLLNKRQKLSSSRSHKESFSNMAEPKDHTRKYKMCNFTCLKRVQLCVKPAGFLVLDLLHTD